RWPERRAGRTSSCPPVISGVERPQRRLRLLQPEGHAHLAVHRGGGGQMHLRLRLIARAPVELAEAEVAVGDQGPHVQFASERERRFKLGLSQIDLTLIERNLGGRTSSPRFETAFAAVDRLCLGLTYYAARLGSLTGQPTSLRQMDEREVSVRGDG